MKTRLSEIIGIITIIFMVLVIVGYTMTMSSLLIEKRKLQKEMIIVLNDINNNLERKNK